MRITKVYLQNFKRFTDLTIEQIPERAKLVLLIGANGSGKSSVFDAFALVSELAGKAMVSHELDFRKNKSFYSDMSITTEYGEIGISETIIQQVNEQSFYGRSSFRQIPRLTRKSLGQANFNVLLDYDRAPTFIDRDLRFENDLEHLFGRVLKDFFRTDSDKSQIKKQIIDPINQALERIFGEQNGTKLQLLELIPPLEGKYAEINFKKGESVFHYNVLSAGEKEVFNILVNLVARGSYYQDTVYYFDEIDLHLNTKLQSDFLKEITENWIPENCQLWTASHALGFIDYARKSETATIIDFDNLDFDAPQTLVPESKESLDLYDIAIPKSVLFDIFDDKRLIFCENKNAEYYNLLKLPKTLFVPKNNAASVFERIKGDSRGESLRDRDFISDNEITKLKKLYPKHHILQYYCFENYLYHPDNINELVIKGFNKEEYTNIITEQKNQKLLYIVSTIKTSRQHYLEFKTDNFDYKDSDSITDDLKSNDFETFYKYFSMKKNDWFNRESLTRFGLTEEKLVSTQWFKRKIEDALNS